jgi:hypothetical protein
LRRINQDVVSASRCFALKAIQLVQFSLRLLSQCNRRSKRLEIEGLERRRRANATGWECISRVAH